ncbi:MAG: hypothetical protein IJI57_10035 [Flexilinea sp.]|nr:hypothetical protein [Flexilinea sp.]
MNRNKLKKLIKGKRPFPTRLCFAFFPALALSSTLLFFVPLNITSSNRNNLSFSAVDILPATALSAGLSLMILLLIAAIPGGKVHAFIVSAYVGISIAFFVQNSFLNTDFDSLDGLVINWKSFSTKMVINLVVWCAILYIPHLIHYFSNCFWRYFSVTVSIILVVIQVVFLVKDLTGLRQSETEQPEKLYLSDEEMFRVGNDKNIVVFLLNETSSKDLQSMSEKYPEVMSAFHDFTGYDNANSHYMYTFPSLINLLTGEEWDSETETVRDYMHKAWQADRTVSFYQKLEDAGFERNFYLHLPYVSNDPSVLLGAFSNLKQDHGFVIDRDAQRNLYKMSAFRCSPIMLKPFFMLSVSDFSGMVTWKDAWNDEWDFAAGMNEKQLTSGNIQNAFIFYSLPGSHSPYKLDESGQLKDVSNISFDVLQTVGKEEQLAGSFTLISSYMDQLKAMGLYEKTGIIILSDHGSNTGKNTDHQPIYFVKMPGQQQETLEMKTNPITIQDCFSADVIAMAGGNGSQWGVLSSQVPDEPVERWTRTFARDDAFPVIDNASFNVMREYRYDRDGDYLIDLWVAGKFSEIPMIDSYY